ncbi:MAG TPA: sulfur carrier protein ThiS [Candidatus Limnocylindrales bacterium]|nr:sulfur carrier protein ThiS [Candidatus Limnocylindrales bacterium]
MRVQINGEDSDVENGVTIAELVARLGLGGRRVAVELNRDVVTAEAWPTTQLRAGDVVEIVHFVGGG